LQSCLSGSQRWRTYRESVRSSFATARTRICERSSGIGRSEATFTYEQPERIVFQARDEKLQRS
jgi:hypothetical protein